VHNSYWYKIQLQKVFQTYSQEFARFVKKKRKKKKEKDSHLSLKFHPPTRFHCHVSIVHPFTVMQIKITDICSQISGVLALQASLLPPASR
jgi:hypothetical protein